MCYLCTECSFHYQILYIALPSFEIIYKLQYTKSKHVWTPVSQKCMHSVRHVPYLKWYYHIRQKIYNGANVAQLQFTIAICCSDLINEKKIYLLCSGDIYQKKCEPGHLWRYKWSDVQCTRQMASQRTPVIRLMFRDCL